MTANAFVLSAIMAVAGAIISLAFQLTPGLTQWFEAKNAQVKSLIMLLVLAVATALIIGVACFVPTLPAIVACNDTGITEAIVAFLFAVMGNQSVHKLAKNAMPTTGVPGSPPAP